MIEVNYNEYKETIAENMELIVENHKLQERIDKAIEYMNNTYDISSLKELFNHYNELEEILKGKDK